MVNQELVHESCEGPQHTTFAPRVQTQVCNCQKGVDRQNYLSHDAIFNSLVPYSFDCYRVDQNTKFSTVNLYYMYNSTKRGAITK